jgi:uncharacterized membrane protein HdeD (DUF308 family)
MATLLGIVLIISGICMLAAPMVAGAVTVMIVGGFMAVAGLVECAHSFRVTTAASRATWLLAGLLTLLCGALVMAHPIFGLGFLTLLLAAYFFVDGFMKVVTAFKLTAFRGWFLVNGLLSFLLAYLIWANWPLSGGWAVGILVGINFIFTGISALAVGEGLKQPQL